MTLRSLSELRAAGLLPDQDAPRLDQVAERYAIAITPQVQALIDAADPQDPIARQFVPDVAELHQQAKERPDPIGDSAHMPVEGVVHRYPDRVLLKLLHACPVYCRFCFRREVVGPGGAGILSGSALQAALEYIARDTRIWEVILTGGDPLALSPRRLGDVMQALAAIAHVKVVRIHTRVPVVDSNRIDDEMLSALHLFPRALYVALHANHPRELTAQAREACARLIDSGVAMVSQTVLLRGVNDDAQVLTDLMRAFVETRIKPYYLHHPDLAPGTGHLRVTIEEGQRLVRQLLGRVSGLCQPAYVLDIPGGFGKSPIGPAYLQGGGEDYQIEDFQGGLHRYRDG